MSVRICPRCKTKMVSHNTKALALRAEEGFGHGFDDGMSDELKDMPFIAYEARDGDDGDEDSIWFTQDGNDKNVKFGHFDVSDFETNDEALGDFGLGNIDLGA